MRPDLVVMAAGLGSRFGGLKQLEAVGPAGETVMDYALFDARRAGIRRVVFVIRRDLEAAFRAQVGDRYAAWLEVDYAFQELDLLPPGCRVPPGRVKPWGTAHAVLAAASQIRGPFITINADDFYGAGAFQRLADWLDADGEAFGMVAYRLANTLSDHGSVARGLCAVDGQDRLRSVTECTGLVREGTGAVAPGAAGTLRRFTGDEPVSMNFWGFRPSLLPELRDRFARFLAQRGTEPGAEFYLPAVVDALLAEGRATVQVLRTPDRWFGVTYRADRDEVAARLRALVAQGHYPAGLWRQP